MSKAQLLDYVQIGRSPFRFCSFATGNAQVKSCQMATGQMIAEISGRKADLSGFNSHILQRWQLEIDY
jgi:hypothetical protein